MNYLELVQRLHRESGRSTAAPASVTGANERAARLFDWVADAWRVQLDEFRSVYVYRTWGDATPIAWTFDESNQLLVAPKPALAYKLRIEYWKSPTELAADTDEPDMPEQYHRLLVWRALQNVAMFDAAPEVLSRAQAKYAELRTPLLLDQARLPHK